MSEGKITAEYTVHCSCGHRHVYPGTSTKREAIDYWSSECGWVLTSDRGWMCAMCARDRRWLSDNSL